MDTETRDRIRRVLINTLTSESREALLGALVGKLHDSGAYTEEEFDQLLVDVIEKHKALEAQREERSAMLELRREFTLPETEEVTHEGMFGIRRTSVYQGASMVADSTQTFEVDPDADPQDLVREIRETIDGAGR